MIKKINKFEKVKNVSPKFQCEHLYVNLYVEDPIKTRDMTKFGEVNLDLKSTF